MLDRSKIKTLPDLFHQRAALTPKQTAYQFYDEEKANWQSICWQDLYKQTLSYRHALASENLSENSRVLLILENSIDWVCLEQATLQLGLVVVAASPLDSLQSLRHVIEDSEPAIIFIESDRLLESLQLNKQIKCIVRHKLLPDSNVSELCQWINKFKHKSSEANRSIEAIDPASIVYTSGSSGTAKGVILSHEAIINNAQASMEAMGVSEEDKILNVTPFSNILGRVVDYYLSMFAGVPLVFNRALGRIDESMKRTHPSLMICTPYILECAYSSLINQNRRLKQYIEDYLDYTNGIGNWKFSFLFWKITQYNLRKIVHRDYLFNVRAIYTAGAPLSGNTRALINILDIPIFEGYGLTEAGGLVSINTPENNSPGSVGKPLKNVQIKLADDHSIELKSNSTMLSYWHGETIPNVFDQNSWLKTGDEGLLEKDVLFLSSRRSSNIQLANGHCICPEPLESRLKSDSIFNNVLIYGNQQVKLTAICEIASSKWEDFAQSFGLTTNYTPSELIHNERLQGIFFTRINALLQSVPDSPRIDYILPTFNDWQEDGLVNAQGVINREAVHDYYASQLALIYEQQYPFKPKR